MAEAAAATGEHAPNADEVIANSLVRGEPALEQNTNGSGSRGITLPSVARSRPSPVSSHAEHISGLVERVTFHSATSGFAVLRVKARGHRELVTVVGTAPSVAVGEWIQATGTWRIDSQYGQQLRDLLYTAITRARKLLVMVGTKRAIATATHRVGSRTRVTTLQERLRDEGEHVG